MKITKNTKKENEVDKTKEEIINYSEYNNDIENQKNELNKKLNSLDTKLIDLEIKESMINNIITRTNVNLENLAPDNYKWIGQTQTTLMKQLESLGLLKDIIIKYEDLIMKYRKMIIDIDEKKIINRLKIASLQKEEEEKESALTDVLANVQNIFNTGVGNNIDMATEHTVLDQEIPMLASIQEELKQEGY